ncbi:MAG: SelT/SelW/SelH family protein [Planctomycetota bacterium]
MASSEAARPLLRIRFCCRCRWWLRAGWMAQELFSTFGDAIAVQLELGDGGEFTIHTGGHCIWDRRTDDGFPEAKQLKQLVRDHCFPDVDIGHAGR